MLKVIYEMPIRNENCFEDKKKNLDLLTSNIQPLNLNLSSPCSPLKCFSFTLEKMLYLYLSTEDSYINFWLN